MTSVSTAVRAPRRGNTRRSETQQLAAAPAAQGMRLRYLLVMVLMAGVVGWLWPRGRAAWQLHNVATALADYSLCMVGPTGPELMKSDPAQLLPLMRLRLIAAQASERPFAECSRFADQLQFTSTHRRGHGAAAAEFREYHAGPSAEPRVGLTDLAVDMAPFDDLAARSWPFVRSGARNLIAASSHAREAMHPGRSPEPGLGSGLPAGTFTYRSTAAFGDRVVGAFGSGANAFNRVSDDAGVTWRAGGRHLAGELVDRCVADNEGRAYTLTVNQGGERVVLSHGPSAAPQVATLAPVSERLAGVACDEAALVAVLLVDPLADAGADPSSSSGDEEGAPPTDAEGAPMVHLRLCPFRRPCQDLQLPEDGPSQLFQPVDVARIGGDTIVSSSHGGITRVASSRDGGRSWSPWAVAYDAQGWAEAGSVSVEAARRLAPYRLLRAGERVLLYGEPGSTGSYALLVSRDHGASFRRP